MIENLDNLNLLEVRKILKNFEMLNRSKICEVKKCKLQKLKKCRLTTLSKSQVEEPVQGHNIIARGRWLRTRNIKGNELDLKGLPHSESISWFINLFDVSDLYVHSHIVTRRLKV
jgi:hypothetical protein